MIVKYLDGDTWVYLDKVIKTMAKYENAEIEVRKYDKKASEMPCTSDYKDPVAFFFDGTPMGNEVVISNKVFSSVTQDFRDVGNNVHCENLISPSTINFPIKTLTLFVEGGGKFDTVILVTNQTAYLMNDNGQTIEKLN